MTNKIALTASMRSNLLSLQSTQKLFDSTQDRLASGYKVNSAMDNPSSYFTAQALNSRANDLSGLLDSIGQAISTLQTADQGITTLQSFVEQAKSIANNARDTANVASKATTNNVKFDPDNARTDLLSDYVNVTAGPSATTLTGSKSMRADDDLASLSLSSGQDLHITAGDFDKTYTFGTGVALTTTVQEFMDQVTEDSEGKVKAELVDGHMKFTAVDGGELTMESTVFDTVATQPITLDNSTAIAISGTDPATMTITAGGNNYTLTVTAGMSTDDLKAAIEEALPDTFEVTAATDVITITNKTPSSSDIAAPAVAWSANVTANPAYDDTGAASTAPKLGSSAAEKLGFAVESEGTSEAERSFSVRLGDATKMVGTANLRADKTLEEMGMIDGQTIDIIVDDKVHTYTVGDDEGQIAKTSTMQEFMDNIVYDIGRTKIKAEITDGALTISTLDNSSLSIRSSQQVETYDSIGISADDIAGAIDSGDPLDTLTFTPDGATTPVVVDVSAARNAKEVVDAINNNADAKAAGIVAELDKFGNVAFYDKDASHSEPASVTLALASTATLATVAGSKDVVLEGTSFNELVGFVADQKVEITDDMTVEQFRQAINNLDGVSADFDTKGHLVIAGEQGDDLVMVNDANSNVLKNLFGSDVVSATNGSNERAKYAAQFDDILSQVDQLVQDTSYKGINLLNGDDLTVVFNESRTSTLELKGVTFDSTGLGFTRSINEWISNEDIDKALTQITKATSLLRAQASEFGQNLSTVQIREDFTQNMINNLQSGADKLTLADMNEEAANMLALQTRQQLATNSLSLANQAAQSVLRLF